MAAPILTTCAGFLLGVLWMDLMFDAQARRSRADHDAALKSIAAYYRRATTTSQPMGALIVAVMATLVLAVGAEAMLGGSPGWVIAASAVLAGGPIALALVRTVPNAVQLGTCADDPSEQWRLARSILRDHILCAFSMAALLAFWLARSLN